MRNQYDKAGFELTPGNPSLSGFGLLHDGSVDSIARFVSEPVFEVQSDQDVADLTALILAFSGGFDDAPANPGPDPEPPGNPNNNAPAAVGRQVTIDDPLDNLTIVNQLVTLANASQIDLIAKGTFAGFPRGWHYIAGVFVPDSTLDSSMNLASLVALASTDSEVTFEAVLLNSGDRLGIDRDDDATLDFDEFVLEDNDGDGISNGTETGGDTDNDGVKNYLDLDSDNDTLSDEDENSTYNTNPRDADTDSDGLPDAWEILHSLDPNDDGTVDPNNGALGDPDNDTYTNLQEFLAGSDPQDNGSFPPSFPAANTWALALLVAGLIATAATSRRRAAR